MHFYIFSIIFNGYCFWNVFSKVIYTNQKSSLYCAFPNKQNIGYATLDKPDKNFTNDPGSYRSGLSGTIFASNRTIRCENKDKQNKKFVCFAFYDEIIKNNNNTKVVKLSGAGCIDILTWNHFKCEQDRCFTHNLPEKAKQKFCCCKKNYCNSEELIDPDYINHEYTETQPELTSAIQQQTDFGDQFQNTYINIFIPILVLIGFCIVIIVVFGLYRYWKVRRQYSDHEQIIENCEKSQANDTEVFSYPYDIDSILEIGRGRFGNVWKANFGGRIVAYKAFKKEHYNHFYSEMFIYKHLEKLNAKQNGILQYFGSYNKGDEMLLVMEYIDGGSLRNFLGKKPTLPFNNAIKLMISISEALAFLHEQRVAHRDLTSTNILVRKDLSCAVCDLGLSHVFGYYLDASTGSLVNGGTPRYMAPELLDGSLNMSNMNLSLRNADIYSLSLILWEIFNVYSTGKYNLPFEHELKDLNATHEAMRLLVCRQNIRPKLLRSTKWLILTELCETIVDCWDSDDVARLTASCVVERLKLIESSISNQISSNQLNDCVNGNSTVCDGLPFLDDIETKIVPFGGDSGFALASDENTFNLSLPPNVTTSSVNVGCGYKNNKSVERPKNLPTNLIG